MASTITPLNKQLIGHNVQELLNQVDDAFDAAIVDIEALQVADAALQHKAAVRGATTGAVANLASFAVANDGITFVAGERVLVQHNASPDGVIAQHSKYQGIYVVGTVVAGNAPLTRATDADGSAEVKAGMLVHVAEGTVNADLWFFLATNDPITLGTTALSFVQVPDYSDVTSADTSLTTRVSTEESTRASADTSLTTRVSAAESTETSTTTSLTTRVSTEESTRASADTSLTTRVSTEESTRSSADTSLTTRVSTAESTETSAMTSANTRVSTEESTRASADTSLTTRVSSAESTETSTTTSLTTRVSTEESTRASADTSLTTRVSTTESTETSSTASIDTRFAAGLTVQKRTVIVSETALTNAVNGASEAENIGAVLPANARIVGVSVHTVTAFTGGGAAAVSLDIGTAGDVDALVDGADMFAAAVDGQASTRPSGIAPNKLFAGAGAQLIATFTPDGGAALLNLTAGACTIDVMFVELA